MQAFAQRDDVQLPGAQSIHPARFNALTDRSNVKGLRQTAGHLGTLCVTGWFVTAGQESAFLLAIALVLHGVVLVFLFAPLHECIHFTAFRSRWLNTVVSNLAGFLLILPPRYFRSFHLAHHRHTQDPVRDPELPKPKLDTWPTYLWHVSGLPFWWERTSTTVRHAFGRTSDAYIDVHHRRLIVREARCFVVAYAGVGMIAVGFEVDALLWLWGLPAVIGQPVLRLFLLAEHSGCDLGDDPFGNTRTTHTSWLVRTLSWNMCYHAEHHLAAAVPFHALPRLHRVVAHRLRCEGVGYYAVNRSLLPHSRRIARHPTSSERGG
ncbi:MAG: fatty acid desaturase [Pseudomonadota bacterium]